MEYVKGMSITRYCDEYRLDVEQRLRLFREVCEGVHHAHQKGIIHRDIKPSNILISLHEDRAVPKIIDFGIAKAATSSLTEKTVFTFQGQLLGTPEYMSPEQVDLATQDIDTRSDIYSLGVVLYELLAGVLPFEKESLQKIGLAELQHTLREVEPASPSIRLANLGDQAKAIADSRKTQVVPLARRLHRELEWIPLKAMRKDRCRRYKSTSDMADDIQSYLNGNPLLAGPETAMYRVQKFVRKHAGSVATVALVSLAVIAGLVVSIVMGCRAEEAREQEAVARVEAEQARDKEAALRVQVEQALARAEKAERVAQEQRELAEQRAEAYRRAVYSNTLALAKVAIDEGSFSRAQKLLSSCEPDLRGWEWEHFNHMSPDPCIRTYLGHQGDAWEVAVSPDGRRLVSAGGDGLVKVWDTATGSEVMSLPHHPCVHTVAYSPDGKHIASGGIDGIVKIWDAATGAGVMTLYGHKDWLWSVAFSPDGSRIASGARDNTVKVWDVDSGAELMTCRGHKAEVWSIVFSPDGKRIVSGDGDRTIRIWDAVTGAEMKTLTGHTGSISDVAISPDGRRIASISGDKTIKVWDAVTGAEIKTLTGHEGAVLSVDFTPDGSRLVSSGGKTIKVWDIASGSELSTLRGHVGGLSDVALSPDGERIFSCSYQAGKIKEWDPAIDRDVLRLSGDPWARHVAFSPDGKRIAGSIGSFYNARKRITLWDATSGVEIMTLSGWHGARPSMAFSPDGKQIVSGGRGKTVQVWNASTGALERTLTGHTSKTLSVAFSPDGKRIVSASTDRTIKVWNAATGAVATTLTGHRRPVNSVVFSPDSRRVISGGDDGTVRLWDAVSGTELLTLHGHQWPVHDVSVSPDGELIASCSGDKTVRVWDATTGQQLMTLHGHKSGIHTVAFSPDGGRIVSGGDRGEVKIWDLGTDMELIDLYGDASSLRVTSAAFSPDGSSICIGGEGGVTLWESIEPAAGYEPRRAADSARDLVQELYEEHSFYEDVISRLEENSTADDSVRRAALRLSNYRLGQDAQKLSSQSWQVVSSPDHNETTYREALARQEKAVSLAPDSPWHLTHLGAAHYRLGAYEEALSTLERAKEMRGGVNSAPDPVLDSFRAMALRRLGSEKEASAVAQRLRGPFNNQWFASYYRRHIAHVVELEKLLAGDDDTLISLLELVEEDKLDEALEVVEKVRSSEDTEAIGRTEGAAKLLSGLYYTRGWDRWRYGGPCAELIADYEKAVRVDPDNAGAVTELARIRINWPDSEFRDGKKAVEAATRACELTNWKDHETIGMLAAAYSETGGFESAIKWQKTALDLLGADCPAGFRAHYQAQLDLYKAGRPYHKGGAWSFSDGELVSHWKFDKVEAGEVFDSVQKGHRGRLMGDANIVSDPERGSVLRLGGKGDYVDGGWNPGYSITGAATIALWTKVTNTWGEDIFSTSGYGLTLRDREEDPTVIEFSCGSLSSLYKGWGRFNAVSDLDKQWHLIVVRYDGEEFAPYIDGEFTHSAHYGFNCNRFCGNIPMDVGPLYIGPPHVGQNTETAKGWQDILIDDVRIYSYALSADEIKMLYEGKEPPIERER